MPVITMLSPKGGVGKTTTALVLATELAAEGARVIIIDADPNYPLMKWAALDGKPDNIAVIAEIDEDQIIETIDEARKRADFVVVDLEGRASARTTNALLMSNLALIPIQGSGLDADQALRAFQSVRSAARVRERPIAYAAVLNRTPATQRVWSRDLKAIVQNLEDAGIPMIATPLAERGAYRGLFSSGGTLATLDPAHVASLAAARENARAFVNDVLETLRQGVPA